MSDYYCPPDNFSISLVGTNTSPETISMQIIVEFCSQDYLDYHYSGKGLKCKSNEEIMSIISYTNMRFALVTDYFDTSDFVNYPIKPTSSLMINTLA